MKVSEYVDILSDVAGSVNGFCGADGGMCPDCPIMDVCASDGNAMIKAAKKWLKHNKKKVKPSIDDRIKEAINSTEFINKVSEAVIGKINEPVEHKPSILTGTVKRGEYSIDGYSITINLGKYVPFKLNERVSISTEESK